MRKFISTLLIMCFMLPSGALAQLSLPESTTVELHGERFEAFDIHGYMELLDVLVQLESFQRENALLREEVRVCEEQVVHLEVSIAALRESLGVLEEDRQRLFGEWRDQNLELNMLRHKPRVTDLVGWTLVALLAFTVLGESLYIRYR